MPRFGAPLEAASSERRGWTFNGRHPFFLSALFEKHRIAACVLACGGTRQLRTVLIVSN